MTKKIIKKNVSTTNNTNVTENVIPSNITNVEDFYNMVQNKYNELYNEKISKDQIIKITNSITESFTDFAKNSDSDKSTCILPNVGRFSVFQQAERDGFNPKTHDKIRIPSKKRVSFKTFPRFSDIINEK